MEELRNCSLDLEQDTCGKLQEMYRRRCNLSKLSREGGGLPQSCPGRGPPVLGYHPLPGTGVPPPRTGVPPPETGVPPAWDWGTPCLGLGYPHLGLGYPCLEMRYAPPRDWGTPHHRLAYPPLPPPQEGTWDLPRKDITGSIWDEEGVPPPPPAKV